MVWDGRIVRIRGRALPLMDANRGHEALSGRPGCRRIRGKGRRGRDLVPDPDPRRDRLYRRPPDPGLGGVSGKGRLIRLRSVGVVNRKITRRGSSGTTPFHSMDEQEAIGVTRRLPAADWIAR